MSMSVSTHVLASAFGLGGMLTQLNLIPVGEGFGLLLLFDQEASIWPRLSWPGNAGCD